MLEVFMFDQKKKIPKISKSSDYLEIITPDQAILILKSLINTDPKIKVEFEKLAKEIIESLNVDELAEEIYFSLDEMILMSFGIVVANKRIVNTRIPTMSLLMISRIF
jgi:hypothetical protein